MKVNWNKIIKGKVGLSKAETAREFGSWYLGRWKRDYPDLYNDRFKSTMPSYRMYTRRRPRRPLYARRRLTPKRAIVLSPSPRRKSRRVGRVYGASGGKTFRFGRSNVGQRVGEGTTKRVENTSIENVSKGTQALESYDLTAVALGDALNERERYVINCRGFKIRLLVRNFLDAPIVFNWAIVAGRSKNAVTASDIFRAYGNGRAQQLGKPSGNGLSRSYGDINTDEYVVMKHKRFVLSEINDPTTTNTLTYEAGKSAWSMKEFYFPLNRQLRYDSTSSTSCTEKVFFICWASRPLAVANDDGTEGQYRLGLQTIMYFKEPKN